MLEGTEAGADSQGKAERAADRKGFADRMERRGGQNTVAPAAHQHLSNEWRRDREETAEGGLRADLEPKAAK